MQTLQINSLLQGGKYKIERVLGQGGFGITYLAEQTMLNRKVAIKEFFYKDYCERNEATSHVTLGTQSAQEMVQRFMNKFIKEAQTISHQKHPNIIDIYDIFTENNTAYYVMEYIEGESLSDMVKRNGALSENTALNYIRQVANALSYIHAKSINHLDIKPANIMVRKSDSTAVLIDFGLSKQYDSTGGQTSSTPIGISEGYAPLEQYQAGGVSTFTPQTDIYSLGASLFYLVTGTVPPSASEVLNNGLPALPSHISASTKTAINQAMQFRKNQRPQGIEQFLKILGSQFDINDIFNTIFSNYQSTADNEATKAEDAQRTRSLHGENENTTILGNDQTDRVKSSRMASIINETSEKYAKIGEENEQMNNEIKEALQAEGFFKFNGVMFKMKPVTGGGFNMVETQDSGLFGLSSKRVSQHVQLSDFRIGETPVTQALFEAVMGFNPSYFKGHQLPVDNVSWIDCQIFLSRINAETGLDFRLPTEAEWEYASRGGALGCQNAYSFNFDYSWVDQNSDAHSHPVALKKPNILGIYDMFGNVWEWCSDWYGPYQDSYLTNPVGPDTGKERVIRGGSWNNQYWQATPLYRRSVKPNERSSNVGFRLALSGSLAENKDAELGARIKGMKLSVICPKCRSRLSINDAPGIQNKLLTCPICKYNAKVSEFQMG